MGTYGNSTMTITFPEGTTALWEMFKWEIETLNNITDLEIEWDEEDLSVIFRTTGEKVCWADDGGPIDTLFRWGCDLQQCPMTAPIQRILKAELRCFSTEFVLDEIDDEKVLAWCDADGLQEWVEDNDVYDFACDSEIPYEHDLAYQDYEWDGKGGWPNTLPKDDYEAQVDDLHRQLARELKDHINNPE